MRYFNCADVAPGCDKVFRGLDDDGIVGRAAEHMASEHGMNDVADKIAAAIR